MLGSSSVAAQLAASQEGLSSMNETVSQLYLGFHMFPFALAAIYYQEFSLKTLPLFMFAQLLSI
jgi:hypothetical protein